jgi:hypothetical protein
VSAKNYGMVVELRFERVEEVEHCLMAATMLCPIT